MKNIIIIIFLLIKFVKLELPSNNNVIKVNKCCEKNQVFINTKCNETNETVWHPMFTNEKGKTNLQINHRLIFGLPDCKSKERRSIYHKQDSYDRLRLLPNGILRHYFDHKIPDEENDLDIEIIDGKKALYHDYIPGKYCLDKEIGDEIIELAIVCPPDVVKDWTTTEFFMRNIISPITHGIGIICLLIVAIIYFVMPTLRDLVGNIITTICMCLIISQTADLIRLLTIFSSHISFIIADIVCYVSLLGAFFWLNCLGYYIWKTFRSRNVFLRITDGKKYCYYSSYAWSCTIILGALAIIAHFVLDYSNIKGSFKSENYQEELGSLGIFIFFVPIAFTIIIDLCFFATTLKIINRMHTYGRIHHKLRHSFRMFLLLLLIMTMTWIFFLMSFFKFDSLINTYIMVNALQAPLIFYVCVFNQKHVSYLTKKTCCYKNCFCKCCRPEPECEWGDEMTAINTGIY